MLAKVLTQVILQLVMMIPKGISILYRKHSEHQARKKQNEELRKKAQKVEDAKNHDDVRTAADDLP